MDDQISFNPNKLVLHLQKSSKDFTKQDIIKFVKDDSIKCG